MLRLVQEGSGTYTAVGTEDVTSGELRAPRLSVADTGYSWLEDYLERLDDVEEFRECRARLPWAVG